MRRRPFSTPPGGGQPAPPGIDPAAGARWPAGSQPPALRPPVVTAALIAANVLMWVLVGLLALGPWLEWRSPNPIPLLILGAKEGSAIHGGEYWRLVTAIFLHAGLLHLAVDMWALLQIGIVCELLYGRARFLILYVCSGVLGSIAGYAWSPALGVGTSGAIFGLFGALIVYNQKYHRDLPPSMGSRMIRSLLPVILLNLAFTLASMAADSLAPAGGLLAGALLAVFTGSPLASPEHRERESLPVPLALLTALGLLAYAAWGLAANRPLAVAFRMAAGSESLARAAADTRALQRETAGNPEDLSGQFVLLSLLLQQQRWPEAAQVYTALARTTGTREIAVMAGIPLAAGLSVAHRGREAEALYRRLLDLDPDNPNLLNGLAYLYADTLNTHLDEAERMARKALAASPGDSMITDTLAWVYFKQGKLADAAEVQREAIRALRYEPRFLYGPAGEADLHYHMGAIEEARGDLTGARREYETALRLNPQQAEARGALARLNARPPHGTLPSHPTGSPTNRTAPGPSRASIAPGA